MIKCVKIKQEVRKTITIAKMDLLLVVKQYYMICADIRQQITSVRYSDSAMLLFICISGIFVSAKSNPPLFSSRIIIYYQEMDVYRCVWLCLENVYYHWLVCRVDIRIFGIESDEVLVSNVQIAIIYRIFYPLQIQDTASSLCSLA